jgi:guanosine-3',5'-bis(diphosphate) 3'-pyrophosphohydrolase
MNPNETVIHLWQRLSTHLTADTRSTVERAYELATRAHEGQWRDGRENQPYISHPLRVALVLADEVRRAEGDLLAVALLHDVLEDTAIPMETMRDVMGADITNAVELLTKEEVPSGGKAARDSAYFAGIINGGDMVRLVKCADRVDNLRGMKQLNDPPRWEKYVKETREHILPIAEMSNSGLYQIMADLIQ